MTKLNLISALVKEAEAVLIIKAICVVVAGNCTCQFLEIELFTAWTVEVCLVFETFVFQAIFLQLKVALALLAVI